MFEALLLAQPGGTLPWLPIPMNANHTWAIRQHDGLTKKTNAQSVRNTEGQVKSSEKNFKLVSESLSYRLR